MQHRCADPVNNGAICVELKRRNICNYSNERAQTCRAKVANETIRDDVYQDVLRTLGLGGAAVRAAGPAVAAHAAQDADARRRLAAAAAEARLGQAAAEARAAARAVQDAEVRRRLLAAAHAHAAHAHASPAHAAVAPAHAAPVAAPVQPVKRCVGEVCNKLLDVCKWSVGGICYITKEGFDYARRKMYFPYENKLRDITYAQQRANAVGIPDSKILKASSIELEDEPHTAISRTIHALVANINTNAAIRTIITNSEVKDALLADINRIQNAEYKRNVIKVYEFVTSKNFLKLLADNTIVNITAEDRTDLQRSIADSIQEDGVFVIFNEVLAAMNRKFDDPANTLSQSTTTLYLSNTNSERSKLLFDYLWEGRDLSDPHFSSINSILRNFGDFKMRVKDSASPTIMFTATLLPPNNSIRSLDIMRPSESSIFFKVFPSGPIIDPTNPNPILLFPVDATGEYVTYPNPGVGGFPVNHDSTGVEFEKSCYKELLKLQEYNVTPNILCTVATSDRVEDFNTFITSKELKDDFKAEAKSEIHKYYYTGGDDANFDSAIRSHFPRNLKFHDVKIIMTQLGGETMNSLFFDLNSVDRKSVMFQLIYNLYVFEQIQFSHGDLHMGNILVQTIPVTRLCYIINGSRFTFQTTKLVKMFDFDHSTICQTTPILYNRNQHFTINQRLNPNREQTRGLNRTLAETNVFNSKLDIVIFMSYLRDSMHRYAVEREILGLSQNPYTDPEFDAFRRQCFPGMSTMTAISSRTVRAEYDIQRAGNAANTAECTRIVGNTSTISSSIYNGTWQKYFEDIGFGNRGFGRIIKSTVRVANNHLWIPNSIVWSNLDMLENAYFASLRDPNPLAPIDNRRQIVYTIDGRI